MAATRLRSDPEAEQNDAQQEQGDMVACCKEERQRSGDLDEIAGTCKEPPIGPVASTIRTACAR